MLTLVSDLRNMSIGILLRLNPQRAEKETSRGFTPSMYAPGNHD